MDFGLLILRLVIGALMIGHGAQKLFGWFGGPGHKNASGYVASRGFQPASFWTTLGSSAEAGGGLLLLLGFLSPLGSIGVASAMLTAISAFHWPKVWAGEGGFEYPLVILTAAVAVATSGPGAYSLDAAFGTSLPAAAALVIAVAAALLYLVGMVTAARARTAAPEPSQKAAV